MRLLSFVAAAAMLSASVAARADTVIVGSSNTANAFPFGGGFTYSGEYQQAYSSSAFSGPVSISAISFFQNIGGDITGYYALSFSTTTEPLTGLSNVYAANVGADQSLFFSGSVNNALSITGTPFVYNPLLGNLLLTVQVLSNASSGSTSFLTSGCSVNTARVYNSSGDGPATVGDSNTCNTSTDDGLLTQFTTTPAAVTPEPSSIALLGTGMLGLAGVVRKRFAA